MDKIKEEKVTPNCWECEHFERIRIYAYCHGGKRVTKIPQKYWYSGQIKFCTSFKEKEGKDNERQHSIIASVK